MRVQDRVIYSSSKDVSTERLESLYFEYMYFDQKGIVLADAKEIEERGVVHLGRRADWFEQELEKKDSFLEQATIGDTCIGFSLYYVSDVKKAQGAVRDFATRHGAASLGYIYLVCVDERWTRHGLGKALAYRTMATFQSLNVGLAVLEVAVKPRLNVRSKHLFERAGWHDSGIITEYDVGGVSVGYSQFEWTNDRLMRG